MKGGNQMANEPYIRKPSKEIERIKRKCLKCNKMFMAEGRYNRICPECTKDNRWLCQNAIEIHQMGY